MPPATTATTQPGAVAAPDGAEDPTAQWLAQMFWEAVGADDVDALTYPPGAGTGTDGTRPSPSKPTTVPSGQTPPASPAPPKAPSAVMANGQDFWAELRKQVTALTDKEKQQQQQQQQQEKQGG